MQSIQYMAMCHEINVGKTGCLTKSRMSVGKYQITTSPEPNDHHTEGGANTIDNFFCTRLEIQNEIKDIIVESIMSNTDVYVVE
jgi:hypothetical protein